MLKTTSQARNLGLIIDSHLNFNSHIRSITKSTYYHSKNISRSEGLMSLQDLEKFVHALMSSRLDCKPATFIVPVPSLDKWGGLHQVVLNLFAKSDMQTRNQNSIPDWPRPSSAAATTDTADQQGVSETYAAGGQKR